VKKKGKVGERRTRRGWKGGVKTEGGRRKEGREREGRGVWPQLQFLDPPVSAPWIILFH